MSSEPALLTAIRNLQNPIPQYVLGTLPAIAILGTTPHSGLCAKLIWFARCLGCPFTGMFYFCNIGNIPSEMCAYWLSAEYFDFEGNLIDYLPVGHHAMQLNPTANQIAIINNWVAEASLLDRLSSLVSLYYIFVGIFAGISKAAGPCIEDKSLQDWPYLPLLFIWTLPVIYVRIRNGRVVDRVLQGHLHNPQDTGQIVPIPVATFQLQDLHNKKAHAAITALASVTLPWLT
ncbi:11317_t:CDS:1, partial [Racocetra persica]